MQTLWCHRPEGARSTHTVLNYVRYATRDAGNPMTRTPSVTGMPPPLVWGHPQACPYCDHDVRRLQPLTFANSA